MSWFLARSERMKTDTDQFIISAENLAHGCRTACVTLHRVTQKFFSFISTFSNFVFQSKNSPFNDKFSSISCMFMIYVTLKSLKDDCITKRRELKTISPTIFTRHAIVYLSMNLSNTLYKHEAGKAVCCTCQCRTKRKCRWS